MLDDSNGTLKSKKKAMAGPACKVNALHCEWPLKVKRFGDFDVI